MLSIAQLPTEIKPQQIIVLRAYDNLQGEWEIEAVFVGGQKVTAPASADEVKELESWLAEKTGWRLNASLNNNGFSARSVGAL